MRGARRHPRFLALVGAFALLACLWSSLPGRLLHLLELRSLDFRFNLRGPLSPLDDVVIVAVDDASLEDPELGAWPWPYAVHARLVRRLSAAGAAVIAFDVLFLEEHRGAKGGLNDFARACREAGNVHLAGCTATADIAATVWPSGLEAFTLNPKVFERQCLVRTVPAIRCPLPSLARSVRGVGIVDVPPDRDGMFRRCLLAVRDERTGALVPSLALSTALQRLGLGLDAVGFEAGRLNVGDTRWVPLDERGCALINHSGGHGSHVTYSYSQVYHGEIPAERFRDRVVLVGISAPGLQAVHPNPFSPNFLGVELNADILSNLLRGDFLVPVNRGSAALLLIGLGVVTYLVASSLEPRWATAVVVAMFVVFLTVALVTFNRFRLALPLVGPSAALILVYLAVTASRLQMERFARRQLVENFARYVPPQVVRQLDGASVQAQLGGVERTVTALFVDIRGFTPRVAELSPAQVVAFLNNYFRVLNDLVYSFDGTVDNIVGDEMLVLFGAPTDQDDQAARAVALALDMLEAIQSSQEHWASMGFPNLRVGIGIDMGPAVVGNLGSENRMHYTAIGAPINVASRLQELTRELEADLLVSDAVYSRCQELVVAECIGPVNAKGVPEPVVVWRVAGRRAYEQGRASAHRDSGEGGQGG